MAKSRKSSMPETVFVYVLDEDDDGGPIYGVVRDVNDISEDQDGRIVGTYSLSQANTFVVTRSLE